MLKHFDFRDKLDKTKFKEFCNKIYLDFEEKYFNVEIKHSDSKRSLAQNALYWGVLIPQVKEFMEETSGENYSPDEIHDFLKYNFGTKVFHESKYYLFINDKKIISQLEWENLPQKEAKEYQMIFRMPSTRGMNTEQFNLYMDFIVKWAAISGFCIEI